MAVFCHICSNHKKHMEKEMSLFGALRLKWDTLKRVKHLKIAFESTYGKEMTNDEFVGQLIAAVEEGDMAVWERFCDIELGA